MILISEKYYEMSSFGEKKSIKIGKELTQQYIEFNRRQLSRIYPAGHRVDSSNYDPQHLWNVGCHLGNKLITIIQAVTSILCLYTMQCSSTMPQIIPNRPVESTWRPGLLLICMPPGIPMFGPLVDVF